MQRLGRLLAAAGAGVLIGLAAGAAAGAPLPPGSEYAWAQPGTAMVATPDAQPPAWIPIAAQPAYAVQGMDYAWAQPGTAPVDQPPASVPTG
jgi:hypothetical protein